MNLKLIFGITLLCVDHGLSAVAATSQEVLRDFIQTMGEQGDFTLKNEQATNQHYQDILKEAQAIINQAQQLPDSDKSKTKILKHMDTLKQTYVKGLNNSNDRLEKIKKQ